jgi:DNA-binding NarL/FixJ family response regulator
VAQRIRVLIIDDNRLMREGLSALLKAQPDLQVVGAVANLAAALRQAPEVTPHVVLVDAGLGSCDGCRCVEQIRRSAPAARAIVMDLLPAPEEVVGYVKAGAKGFIMKDATVEDLLGTVRSVARGSDVIPPVLTGTLLSHIAQDAVVHQRPEAAAAVRMTKREQQVMQLITDGLDNKAIAQRLSIAGDTVKSHVRNILEKLTLHSRLAIAAHSRRSNAARPSPSSSGTHPARRSGDARAAD